MTAADMVRTIRWAAALGWNPGQGDGTHFLAVDPGGFLAAEVGGRMVGAIGAPRFGPAFAFAGLYIVAPEHRGGAVGLCLARAALELAGDRVIGTDGVLEREEAYARLGFTRAHLHQRHSGLPRGAAHPAVADLGAGDAEALVALDDACFPGDRRAFMRGWLGAPHLTKVSRDDAGTVDGFAVA
ncbi:MAG: GNAT family N-acetyltransferase, partial [Miltoncostaeaceae bacterium]